jgi:flagellar export protein FliJ
VKRFQFSLAKVLDFRRQQLEMEQAKLEALVAERQPLDAQSARIEGQVVETRRLLMVTGSVAAQELVASDAYLHYLAGEKKRHAAKMADWQARATKQEQATVEARRRVRLMEKLEERKLREWKARVDREQENLSGELYLARWKR